PAAMHSFERALSEAQSLQPADEHYIRLWRAITLLGLGKPQLAFRDLLLALEFFRLHYLPAHALLAFNVGATLLHAGDWEGAESCIRIALAESGRVGMPGFETMCRSNLAYCLINVDRVDEATAEIDQALGRDRAELLRYRPGDVMTTVAENLIETGHLEEATDYVFAALDDAIGRRYAMGIGTAKWNQGRIAVERKRIPEAVSAWRVALWNLRRHPHLTQFWKTAQAVSTLYSNHGDYRRALRWHRRFHASFRRWQDTTRDVRLAYSQATLQMEAIRLERDAAESERLRLLQAKSELEAVNTELQSRFTQIEAIHDELRDQASRDLLTGLLNRRNLLPTLEGMLEKSAMIKQHAIVAMLDLDNFKQFNDKHGHVAGDEILAAAGHLLREFFRDEDSAFRYGGDEFCIFLPHTNRMVGEARLEAFAQALHDSLPRAPDGALSGVKVSFGIACFPDDSAEADELLGIADAALYRIKRRNKESAKEAAKDPASPTRSPRL
ncbi:MAG: diguanylate cyclase, partial [Burkholderiaceae bacterium]